MKKELTRRSFMGTSAGLALALSLNPIQGVRAEEISHFEIAQYDIDGSPLKISVSSEPGVHEALTYALRRYFYEIDFELTQEDILDASSISNYLSEHDDFMYSHRVISGHGILVNYQAYPPGSDEIFDDIQNLVMQDILESMEHKIIWGGSNDEKMVAYLGIREEIGFWEKQEIVEEVQQQEVSEDQGPGTEADMFTS